MAMMRMAPDGKHLMCRSCIERKPVQKQEAVMKNKQKKQVNVSEPARSQLAQPEFKEYFCKSCKYSFKRAKHLAISTCPYCDSNSLMVKGSVARIMADVAKMKGD